jgi:hypothetical protein
MSNTGSTLIAHCGARKVTRAELQEIPVPETTRTHQPLSHFEIVEVLEEALSFRYLKIVRDEYAVSQDGMKMFGVMDLNTEFNGGRFSIGIRNSNDKSMRLALTAGVRVFVCDNMAFSGDFTPLLHKHSRKLELRDAVSIAVDRIHRGFEPLKQKIELMKKQSLSDEEVMLIIYRAFLNRQIKGIPRHLMPIVHEHYFHPKREAFIPRNLWSLSNAFTSGFKKLAPVKQFEVTARLGSFLAEIQETLSENRELALNLQQNREDFLPDRQSDVLALLPNPQAKDFGYENFDAEDVAEDPYDNDEIFDEYFDREIAEDDIDEATERIIEKYEARAAA